MSLKSPLGRVLGLGSAKDGTDHWLAQRISAVALVLLGLWFVVSLAVLGTVRYGNIVAFLGKPLNGVLMALLCVTLAYHSYLGVQVVIEDYVHTKGIKMTSLIVSRFAHIFVAIASVYAILRIGIGT